MTILEALTRTWPLANINDPNTSIYQALTGLMDGPAVAAGVSVNAETAMRNVAVYAATTLIAQALGAMPTRIVLREDRQRIPQRPSSARALWQRMPNPDMTQMELRETAVLSCLLHGNAYFLLFNDRGGNLAEMWPLDPSKVSVGRARTGELRDRKVFQVAGVDEVLTDDDILHVPATTRPGHIAGLSPIRAGAQAIGTALAAEEHAANFFGSGATIDGYLSFPGELTPEQADQLSARWARMAAGRRNSRRVAVLTHAGKFEQVQIPPADSDLLKMLGWGVRQVATLYRIAPHLIGDVDRSTSWGTGIEEQTHNTVTFTYGHWATRFERRFELLLEDDLQFKFVFDSLLRGTTLDRYRAYALGRQWGWFSINKILELEDMPGIGPEGDVHLQPLNMVPAGAGTEPERQAAVLLARARAAVALSRFAMLNADASMLAVGLDPVEHGELYRATAAEQGDVEYPAFPEVTDED